MCMQNYEKCPFKYNYDPFLPQVHTHARRAHSSSPPAGFCRRSLYLHPSTPMQPLPLLPLPRRGGMVRQSRLLLTVARPPRSHPSSSVFRARLHPRCHCAARSPSSCIESTSARGVIVPGDSEAGRKGGCPLSLLPSSRQRTLPQLVMAFVGLLLPGVGSVHPLGVGSGPPWPSLGLRARDSMMRTGAGVK
jgi:hypothetical protein